MSANIKPDMRHSTVGQPIEKWREHGSLALEKWILGRRVSDIDGLEKGGVYLMDSVTPGALNLIRIVDGDDSGLNRQLVMALFINPENPTEKRLPTDKPFTLWGHDIGSDSSDFYRVTAAS
jgi:hypothetical protein